MSNIEGRAQLDLYYLAQAQITLSPDDLRLSLGMTWEQEIATVLSSLEDTDFDVGSAGADQSSDLTGSISNSILAFVRSSVISLEQVPDAASFPDADYAIYNIATAPNATGGTDEIETYHYFQRSPEGDVLVGAEGPARSSLTPTYSSICTTTRNPKRKLARTSGSRCSYVAALVA